MRNGPAFISSEALDALLAERRRPPRRSRRARPRLARRRQRRDNSLVGPPAPRAVAHATRFIRNAPQRDQIFFTARPAGAKMASKQASAALATTPYDHLMARARPAAPPDSRLFNNKDQGVGAGEHDGADDVPEHASCQSVVQQNQNFQVPPEPREPPLARRRSLRTLG